MTYVIVGFKANREHSVHLAKAETNVDCLKEVARAFDKGAEFITIRRVS